MRRARARPGETGMSILQIIRRLVPFVRPYWRWVAVSLFLTLLGACTALELLERRGDRFRNAPLAEEFLVRGKPHYFGRLVATLNRRF